MIQARKTCEGDCQPMKRPEQCLIETHLNNTFLDVDAAVLVVANPGDTAATKSADTHTQDTAQDGVSSRDGKPEARGHGEVAGRGDDGANHAQHEQRGLVVKGTDVDDLGSDGVGYTSTDSEGTGELHEGGAQHGLEVGHGAGGDRAGPRVGDIVGTNVPRIEEGEEGADGKEVVVLVESSHGDRSLRAVPRPLDLSPLFSLPERDVM